MHALKSRIAGVWLVVFSLSLAFGVARAAVAPPGDVAWQPAANDADIQRAFALARHDSKPVLLYWGATWCPPCNQLKATLFNRQDFAVLARSFVAVHVDGDLPGAQKLGQRFKVTGYPTVVLFSPQGKEITRLPGEVDPPQALAILQLGLAGGRPVKAVLDDALAGRALSPGEWRMLAFYSWETDDQQLVPSADVPDTLVRLALAAPPADPEIATRLWLKALAASDDGRGVKADAALRQRVLAVLRDPVQSRLQMDVLTNSAAEIVRALGEGLVKGLPKQDALADLEDRQKPGAPGASEVLAAYDTALVRLQGDRTLSRADRLGALIARVELARIDMPDSQRQVQLPAPLLNELRARVAQDDREITDPYERQAVITGAAYALAEAGLWADSDALLKSNLERSHSPYYLMSQLAGNARKLGHNAEALGWYAKAFEASIGPATRLQWGSRYLAALVDLAPGEGVRIERTADQLLTDAAADDGAFEGRSRRSLQEASAKVVAWNVRGVHAVTLQRLQARRDKLCQRVDPAQGQRKACSALFEPPGKAAS